MEQKEHSFFQNLWERRFIQFSFSYLLGSFGLVQFAEWASKRYALSVALPDIVLLFFLLLLPAVLVFIYNHGKPGAQPLTRVERILIPSNLLLAFAITGFSFKDKAFAAPMETVQLTDEYGTELERSVPKLEFTRRIAILPFSCEDCLESDRWMSIALAQLVEEDLGHNFRSYVISPLAFSDTKNTFGKKYYEPLPFTVQQKMAEDQLADFHISGKVVKSQKPFAIEFDLFKIDKGKALLATTLEGDDLFELVDQFSAQAQEIIYKEKISSEQNTFMDLPVQDCFSTSAEAFADFARANVEAVVNNNYPKAAALLQSAIEKDPGFVIAHRDLANIYFLSNQPGKARASIEEAMKGVESLPERMQMNVKFMYYVYSQDMNKGIKLVDTWRQLYPHDYRPYALLLRLYDVLGEHEEGINIAQNALKNGHAGNVYLSLAKFHRQQGKTEEAISYYQEFEKRYPNRSKEVNALGEIYLEQGNFDKAKAFYERLQLLHPDDPGSSLQLGQIEERLGNYSKSYTTYMRCLKESKSPRDSASVLRRLEEYYFRTGQILKSLNTLQKRWSISATYLPPLLANQEKLSFFMIDRFRLAGKEKEILGMIKEIFGSLGDGPEKKLFRCAGLVNYNIALLNKEGLQEIMTECGDWLESNESENRKFMIQGFMKRVEGDYSAAIANFEKFIELSGNDFSSMANYLGEIYRLDGQPEKAIALYQENLKKDPFNPVILYNYALALDQEGDRETAISHIKKANEIWENADSEFLYAQEASALLQQWLQ